MEQASVEQIKDEKSSIVPDWSGHLITRTGFAFWARPVRPSDADQLSAFFDNVSKEDLRFRFLTGFQHISADRIEAMTAVDHKKVEHFLALEHQSGTLIASAMLAASDANGQAEVALSILPEYKKRGISWTLLNHIARFAQAKGFKTIESLESRANHDAIELEKEMGFATYPCPGDATLMIVRAELAQAA